MSKKKKPPPPVRVCGKCAQRIDNATLEEAMRKGEGYVHECGKRLLK